MNDAAHLFNQIDTDESGTIDADELLNHLLEAGNPASDAAKQAVEDARPGLETREVVPLSRHVHPRPGLIGFAPLPVRSV